VNHNLFRFSVHIYFYLSLSLSDIDRQKNTDHQLSEREHAVSHISLSFVTRAASVNKKSKNKFRSILVIHMGQAADMCQCQTGKRPM